MVTFVVRFWRETTAGGLRWRGQIAHVQSGESAAFLDVDAIRRFGVTRMIPACLHRTRCEPRTKSKHYPPKKEPPGLRQGPVVLPFQPIPTTLYLSPPIYLKSR